MATVTPPLGAQAQPPMVAAAPPPAIQSRTNTAALMVISGVLASSLTYLVFGFGYAAVLFTVVVIATGCYYFSPQEEDAEEQSEAFRTMQYIFSFIWLTATFNVICNAFRRASNTYPSSSSRCPMSGRYRPGTRLPSNHPPVVTHYQPDELIPAITPGPSRWEHKNRELVRERGEVQETTSSPLVSNRSVRRASSRGGSTRGTSSRGGSSTRGGPTRGASYRRRGR